MNDKVPGIFFGILNLYNNYSLITLCLNYFLHYTSTVALERRAEFSPSLSHRDSWRGSTALHYAAIVGDSEIVSTLLRSGASAAERNEAGLRPGDYVPNQNKELNELIDSYTAKVRSNSTAASVVQT